jgi:hypothetical protein
VVATWIAGGLAAGLPAPGRRRVALRVLGVLAWLAFVVAVLVPGTSRWCPVRSTGCSARPTPAPRATLAYAAPLPPPLTTRSKRATTSTCGVWGKASTTVASTSR